MKRLPQRFLPDSFRKWLLQSAQLPRAALLVSLAGFVVPGHAVGAAAVSKYGPFPLSSAAPTSSLFGGGPFYINATNNISEIKNSGFTEVVVWNIEVKANGDLNFNGEFPLVSGGAYIGNQTHSDFASNMALLKTGTVKRITFSVGSSNVGDWQDVKALVQAQGTGSSSILYKNFQALKAAIPAVDALDFDDENSFDQSSTVQFAVMLGRLGYHVALDPFDNASYWQSVASSTNAQLSGTVDSVHLQTYAGGSGNNPCSGWGFGSVPVWPVLWDQDDTPSQVAAAVAGDHSQCGTSGAFIWLYDDFVGNGLAAQYASAINTTLTTDTGAFNGSWGIATNGSTFQSSLGFDGDGNAYSATLLGSTLNWNGVTFTLGPPNGLDHIQATGQAIAIVAPQGASLALIGAGVNGAQTNQVFVVKYTDGSSDTFTRSLSDWFSFNAFPGESIVTSTAYRDVGNGTLDHRTFYVYGYTLSTNSSKTIASLTLPNNTNVRLLGIELLQ